MDGAVLRGKAVVSVQQAEKLGVIDDLLLDLDKHTLGGFALRGGLFRGGPIVRWAAVRAVGADAVTVDDQTALSDADKEQAANLVRLATLRNIKVVTDTGDLLGTIGGVDIDAQTGQVTHYVVTAPSSGLLNSREQTIVSPAAVLAVGPELVTLKG